LKKFNPFDGLTPFLQGMLTFPEVQKKNSAFLTGFLPIRFLKPINF